MAERGRGSGKPAKALTADAPARSSAQLVLMGVIVTAHGIRGAVKIKSFASVPAAIGGYGPLLTADGRAVEITNVRADKKDMVIAGVKDVSNRNQAEALRGTKLFLPRDRLPMPESDEYYHADLVGLAAQDEAGVMIGTVRAVLNFGAGDVLEIAAADGGDVEFFAFTKATVVSVDLTARRIVLAPPDGID